MNSKDCNTSRVRLEADRRLRLVAGLGLVVVLTACGGGGGDDGGDSAGPVASASATIGAAGGTVVGPDDVRIEIPAGALSADTVITIRKTGAGAPALPASAAAASAPAAPMYEITPHGLHFDAPVTVSLRSALDPAVDPVLMAEPGGAWELVNAAAADGRVSWSTTHFSWTLQYPCSASYPPGTPLPPNGPTGCQWPSSSVQVSALPAAALTPTAPYRYRVDAAADVTATFSYSAPLDCVNPAIRTWRFKRPATTPAPAQITTTPVVLVRTAVPRIPGAFRLTGSTPIDFRFDAGDNGTHETGYAFACQGGLTVGGAVQFVVAVPQAPAAPAAPAITQQPASTAVVAGATASFDVLATAPDNLVVRWERQDLGAAAFAPVPGAAPLPGGSRQSVVTQLADSGARYRAQVCNRLNAVETCLYSATATLTVDAPPSPPPAPTAAPSRLSGAFLATCGVAASGGALCWGANSSGELGRGLTVPTEATPAPANGLVGVTSIGASSYVACAIHGGGRLSCWGGYPAAGQFAQSAVPVAIAGVTTARLVRVANGTYCHVDEDRHVRCSDATGPLQIDGQDVNDAVDVAFTGGGRCVLLASGDARCGIFDSAAALVTSRVVPMVRSLGSVPGFSGAGVPFCVALLSGGVRCWGSNANGQLGTGNADLSVTDATIPGIVDAVAVAVGTRHACALSSDGRVRCWGSGYLGNGAGVETTQPPHLVSGLTGIVEITAGYDTTCALRNSGEVLCWGDNAQGSMGTGAVGGAVLIPQVTAAGAVFVR